MTQHEIESRALYEQLQPGDRVKVEHDVTVGSTGSWRSTMTGRVLRRERRRHGLHFRRSGDDKVYSDVLILVHDSGEHTTITMDEFTRLERA